MIRLQETLRKGSDALYTGRMTAPARQDTITGTCADGRTWKLERIHGGRRVRPTVFPVRGSTAPPLVGPTTYPNAARAWLREQGCDAPAINRGSKPHRFAANHKNLTLSDEAIRRLASLARQLDEAEAEVVERALVMLAGRVRDRGPAVLVKHP